MRISPYYERSRPSRRSGSGMQHRARGRRHRKERAQGSAWHWFKHDLRDVRQRYGKETSAAHKRFVLLLVLLGAAARAWFLNKAITVPEASMYMAFGTQTIGGIFTDYSLPTNHVLHTLLMKASTGLFGLSTVSLRLPAFLAGVLALPLAYLLARSLFNRYIALMFLAMIAGYPPLIEGSVLAMGYSIGWCAWLTALLLARHLVRENNPWSAIFMGLSLALGMWSVPTTVYAAAMAFLWVLFSLLGKYQRSLNERMTMLGVGVVVFMVATVLAYLPVVLEHGVDELFHHSSEGETTWAAFAGGYADLVIRFWVYIADPSYGWVMLLGFGGMLYATFISGKYRALAFATLLGSMPLGIALREDGPPWTWAYILFIFCLGAAIGLFYLLKLIQEKLISTLGKRTRTAWASAALFVIFASGLDVSMRRLAHQPEARPGAALILEVLRPEDRLCFDTRWEGILSFELLAQGMPLERLRQVATYKGEMEPGSTLWVPIGKRGGPDAREAITRCGLPLEAFSEPEIYREWQRLEIFAARKR